MNIRILCLVIIAFNIIGCRKKDPEPQNSDPIYLDILKELRSFEQSEAETIKKLEESEKELAKSEPRTIERKNAQKEVYDNQNKLIKVREMIEYYKIRALLRKAEARRKYDVAFEKNDSWPDKKDYEAYLVNKKLVNASRNWNNRVPKAGETREDAEDLPKADEAPKH